MHYSNPQPARIQIEVYDKLGKKIETLINTEKPAGTYDLARNAASGSRRMPGGVYFVQLRTGSYVETKKMILPK